MAESLRLLACGLFWAGTACAGSIDWETVTPFRLFGNQADAQRLVREIGGAASDSALLRVVAQAIDARRWPYESTAWDREKRSYFPGYALPTAHRVRLHAPAALQAFDRCLWTFRWGRDDNGTVDVAMPAACREPVEVDLPTHGRRAAERGELASPPRAFDATAQVSVCAIAPEQPPGSPLECAAGGPRHADLVEVRDLLILSLGDSYASGQGNPDRPADWSGFVDVPDPRVDTLQSAETNWYVRALANGARPAEWWDRACHRSLLAWPALAAMKLAGGQRKRSVTYLSFACSGATVSKGLKEEQTGLFAGGGTNPPQIGAAQGALSRPRADRLDAVREPGRPVDFLALSIGGNDIDFAEVVTWGILPGKANPVLNIMQRWAARPLDAFRFADNITARYETRLDQAYEAIHRAFDLAPERITLLEYPSPLAGTERLPPVATIDWVFDGLVLFMPFYSRAQLRINHHESRLIQNEIETNLLPRLRAFTEKAGWRRLHATSDLADHGYWSLPPVCDDRVCHRPRGSLPGTCELPDIPNQMTRCWAQAKTRVCRQAHEQDVICLPGTENSCALLSPLHPTLRIINPRAWRPYAERDLWFVTLNASSYTQLADDGYGHPDMTETISGTAHPGLGGHAHLAMRWVQALETQLARQATPASAPGTPVHMDGSCPVGRLDSRRCPG